MLLVSSKHLLQMIPILFPHKISLHISQIRLFKCVQLTYVTFNITRLVNSIEYVVPKGFLMYFHQNI